jgi:serine/threonine protein kinase
MVSLHGDPLGISGLTLDKYVIGELAGEGGFSCVYKAEHQIWQEPVAIKFFRGLSEAKPELRETLLNDFIQEGRLMSKLSSRSAAIVQARDIGRIDLPDGEWVPYMVLEWLDGLSLEQALAREKNEARPARDLAASVRLLDAVAKALDVAHSMKVAHRDLKPANIMIMGDPSDPGVPVKVLDFGIAKVMAAHQELQTQLQMTGNQMTAFTPNYGAPEQYSRQHGATGPWTDVFAMALILLEVMRGGQRALRGSTFFELGYASSDPNKRPTPRSFELDVSDGVEALFARALAVKPAERPPSMGAFWGELHALAFPGSPPWIGAGPKSQALSMSSPSARAMVSVDDGDAAVIGANETMPSQPGLDARADAEAPVVGAGHTEAALSGTLPRESKRGPAGTIGVAAALLLVLGGSAFWLGRGAEESTAAGEPSASPVPASSAPAPDSAAERSDSTAPSDSAAPVDSAATPEPSASSSVSARAAAPAPVARTSRPSAPPPPAKPAPPPVKPAPPPPAKPAPPPPKTGSDAWDPSNFGGR